MTPASRACYLFLVIISIAFVMTVMAFTLLPWETVPPWLKENLLLIVLAEVGGIIVLGLLSMGLDNPPTSPAVSLETPDGPGPVNTPEPKGAASPPSTD